MKKTFLSTLIAVLLLPPIASLASAAPPAAQVATPFVGNFHGAESYTFDFPNNRFFVNGNGTGTATHLGLYTVHYGVEVSMSTGVGTNDQLEFTAANGDVLDAAGTGLGVPTDMPGINLITEKVNITGGTGRFAGASGSYVMQRFVVLATGETWGQFQGSIQVPTGN